MTLIRDGDKKTLRRKCNIVDELKDLLNKMCVTDDIEQLNNVLCRKNI